MHFIQDFYKIIFYTDNRFYEAKMCMMNVYYIQNHN